MPEIELDQARLDALREIGSIAAGNTATDLSTMLGRKVSVAMPDIVLEALENIPEALGGEESPATVVYFRVSGRLSGSILLIFSVPDSRELACILTGKTPGRTGELDEMGVSAMKELGNITAGSYLRAMEQMLKKGGIHSVPGFACDMLGAALDGILARLSLEAGCAVITKSEFIVGELACKAYVVFIPEPGTLKAILGSIGRRKERAEDMREDNELMKVFREEAEGLIDKMKKELSAIKNEPQAANRESRIRELARCAHTMKGNSAMLGFSDLKEVALGMEEIFRRNISGGLLMDAGTLSLLSEGVDTCRRLLNGKKVPCGDLLERMRNVLEKGQEEKRWGYA